MAALIAAVVVGRAVNGAVVGSLIGVSAAALGWADLARPLHALLNTALVIRVVSGAAGGQLSLRRAVKLGEEATTAFFEAGSAVGILVSRQRILIASHVHNRAAVEASFEASERSLAPMLAESVLVSGRAAGKAVIVCRAVEALAERTEAAAMHFGGLAAECKERIARVTALVGVTLDGAVKVTNSNAGAHHALTELGSAQSKVVAACRVSRAFITGRLALRKVGGAVTLTVRGAVSGTNGAARRVLGYLGAIIAVSDAASVAS